MPTKTRKKASVVEERHGHCADLLMSDYGIPNRFRSKICKEIDKIYEHDNMVHCQIIWSVRGFEPRQSTRFVEGLLNHLRTHPPKNHKEASGASS